MLLSHTGSTFNLQIFTVLVFGRPAFVIMTALASSHGKVYIYICCQQVYACFFLEPIPNFFCVSLAHIIPFCFIFEDFIKITRTDIANLAQTTVAEQSFRPPTIFPGLK